MEDSRKIYEEYSLDPETATESDLQDARMQRLSEKLGVDVEQISSKELDEARLRVRNAAGQTSNGFKKKDFLYWN